MIAEVRNKNPKNQLRILRLSLSLNKLKIGKGVPIIKNRN